MRYASMALLALLSGLTIASGCGDGDNGDLLREASASPTVEDTASQGTETPYPEGTVAGILSGDGRFGTLLQVLEAAEVRVGPPGSEQVLHTAAESMGEPGWDHTIFAPTDAAFESLDESAAAMLSDPESATQFVRRHVIPELIAAADLETGNVLAIAGRIDVTVADGDIEYGGAPVVETDIEASNGIIHVIDGVVFP